GPSNDHGCRNPPYTAGYSSPDTTTSPDVHGPTSVSAERSTMPRRRTSRCSNSHRPNTVWKPADISPTGPSSTGAAAPWWRLQPDPVQYSNARTSGSSAESALARYASP